MFDFLKRKKRKTDGPPPLADLKQVSLAEGDMVESLRYDLGICRVLMTEKGLTYQSLADGRQVSWHLMVDAATDLQKVKKIIMKDGQEAPAPTESRTGGPESAGK